MAEEPRHVDEVQEHGPAPPEPHRSPENPDVAHEESDVDVKYILYFAAVMAASAVVIHLGLAWMFFLFKGGEEGRERSRYPLAAEEARNGPVLPEPPRLDELQRQLTGRQPGVSTPGDVEGYRWVDREKGIVSVPVDRAIDRLLERMKDKKEGGHTWEDAERPLPSDANSGRGPRKEDQ